MQSKTVAAASTHGTASRWESVAAGTLVALLVLCWLLPADSVAVERGEGAPAQLVALMAGAFCLICGIRRRRGDRWLHGLTLGIAGWTFLSVLSVHGQGNFRAAVNEGWMWLIGPLLLLGSRLILRTPGRQRLLVTWVVAMSSALAVHAWWQCQVEFPALQAAYFQDPEGTAQAAGIHAPVDSPQHRAFFDRLFSTEPYATFALTNSLALVLLLAVLVVLFSAVSAPRGWMVPCAWPLLGCGLLLLATLWITKSRTALLALIVVGGGGIVWQWVGRRTNQVPMNRRRVGGWMALAAVVALGAIVAVIAKSPDLRVLSEAPMSIQFRMQYWQGSLSVVRQYPWFGAGPGNFREAYALVRPMAAFELPAEPHNWWFEALTSGGIPLGLLTFLWVARVVALVFVSSDSSAEEPSLEEPSDRSTWDRWCMDGGACVGALLALVLGIRVGTLPPLDVYGTLLVPMVILRVMLRPWVKDAAARPQLALAIGTLGVLLGLLAAGGWTTPGVMFPWMIVAGAAIAGKVAGEEAAGETQRRRRAWLTGAASGLLLGLYGFTTWQPIVRSQQAIAEAGAAQAQGRLTLAFSLSERAVETDPWSVDAEMLRCGLMFSQARSRRLDDTGRAVLRDACQRLQAKDPRNPALFRWLGDQWIVRYQSLGEVGSLRESVGWYREAALRHPTDAASAAQLAMVLKTLADTEWTGWADRARAIDVASPWQDLEALPLLVPQAVETGEPIPRYATAGRFLANPNP